MDFRNWSSEESTTSEIENSILGCMMGKGFCPKKRYACLTRGNIYNCKLKYYENNNKHF
jgi:hypothetical protein